MTPSEDETPGWIPPAGLAQWGSASLQRKPCALTHLGGDPKRYVRTGALIQISAPGPVPLTSEGGAVVQVPISVLEPGIVATLVTENKWETKLGEAQYLPPPLNGAKTKGKPGCCSKREISVPLPQSGARRGRRRDASYVCEGNGWMNSSKW